MNAEYGPYDQGYSDGDEDGFMGRKADPRPRDGWTAAEELEYQNAYELAYELGSNAYGNISEYKPGARG